MGTRHCIIVIKDKEPKIAQYGQFDGYPSGRGADILHFLKEYDLSIFSQKLDSVRFISDDEVALVKQQCKSENRFLEDNPEFNRNTSAEILNLVYEGTVRVLVDNSNFAQNSLFCEWCYVIDLDKKTFEVYKGFNTIPLTKKDRFYIKRATYGKYYPVKLVKTYKLNKLPKEVNFLEDLKVIN